VSPVFPALFVTIFNYVLLATEAICRVIINCSVQEERCDVCHMMRRRLKNLRKPPSSLTVGPFLQQSTFHM
jgi:hypothetical protein